MQIWILTQFYPPEFGAAAIRLSRLARLLAADGHHVTVITGMPNYPEGVIHAAYRGKLTHTEQIDGVTIARAWVFASARKDILSRLLNQFSFTITGALRGTFLSRPDVILVESHPLFVTISGGWLGWIKRALIVLNVSDLWPESAVATGVLKADSLMVRIGQRVEAWAYRRAAHIVGMTQGIVTAIRARIPAERVTLIGNAVDLDVFQRADVEAHAAARRALNIAPDQVVAAHVGNMSLTYDFDIILEAAAALPDVLFLFAGGGSQLAHVETRARELALNNLRLLGVLPHADMPRIWAAADISLIALGDHVLAGETLPAKLYESLATGTPVVAAIRGEGAALIERANAGTLVAVGDAAAFRDALRDLAEAPDQRAIHATAARAYAEVHLAPHAVKAAYLALFEHVRNSK